ARRVQADLFDRADELIDLNCVADVEWPVENDRNGREEIAEDVLDGECYRDTADAEPRDERCDRLVEDRLDRDEDDDDPRNDLRADADRPQGGHSDAIRGLVTLVQRPGDEECDETRSPHPDLEQE